MMSAKKNKTQRDKLSKLFINLRQGVVANHFSNNEIAEKYEDDRSQLIVYHEIDASYNI